MLKYPTTGQGRGNVEHIGCEGASRRSFAYLLGDPVPISIIDVSGCRDPISGRDKAQSRIIGKGVCLRIGTGEIDEQEWRETRTQLLHRIRVLDE